MENRIEFIQEDCMRILNDFEDNSIDCIITSPPYNKSFFSKQKKTNQIWGGFEIKYSQYDDCMPLDQYEKWMINFINVCLKKIKSNGSIFFNHKPIRYKNQVYEPISFILSSNAKIYQEIIWDRGCSPNIRNDILVPTTERIFWLCKQKPIVHRQSLDNDYISEVWKIKPSRDKFHPATFPLQIPINCILLTTKENDLVVDPFCGVGTVGIACKRTNRNFIGIEIDKNYLDIAKERTNNEQN